MNERVDINLTATGKARSESRIDGEMKAGGLLFSMESFQFSDENDLLTSCG